MVSLSTLRIASALLVMLTLTSAVAASPRRSAYDLVSHFLGALQEQNYTHAASLMNDNGYYVATDLGCVGLSKSDFIEAAKNVHAGAPLVLGDVFEAPGTVFIKALVGGSAAASAPNPHVFITASTIDGAQLLAFGILADRAAQQPQNASAMLNVWNTLIVTAEETGDVALWRNGTVPEFMGIVAKFTPGAVMSPLDMMFDYTRFMTTLERQYQKQANATVVVNTVFPVCEALFGDITVTRRYKDGTVRVLQEFIGLELNTDFKVKSFSNYVLTNSTAPATA